MKTCITLVIILILLVYLDQTKARLRVIYQRVDCFELPKESKLQVHICRIAPHNNSFFQGEFEITEDVDNNKLKLSVEIYKCLVGEAPDTCEFLINLTPPNVCMTINAENMAWNAVTDAFTPKLRCPLKKGIYVGDKVTFDASKWNIFPLDNWHFKINVRMYEGDILSLAMRFESHFIRVH